MLSRFVSLFLALAGFTPILQSILSYFWDAKGLRKYPSASAVAAVSPLWRIWHNVHFRHYAAVDDAHKRLGSHVRIAPNHVSVLDPRAPYDIYGHGANMLKEEWYDAGAGAHRNLADTRDKAEHQAKRKMMAHTFAAKTVSKFEPVLQEQVGALMAQLDHHIDSGTRANMRRLINYFTIDLFGQVLFGHKLGCLRRGNDNLVAESKAGRLYEAPFIQSLLDVTVINTVLGMVPGLLWLSRPLFKSHPYKRAGTDWENIVYYNTKERISKQVQEDDLFQRLLQDTKGHDLHLSMGEIVAECSAMMNAGTETTTAAMTNTIFLLFTHAEVLAQLREELDKAFPGDEIPTYEAASKLPYLRACIEESLRVRPASSMGLPRIVPPGGRVIAGQFIAEGVTVSVPTYSLLRNEKVFTDATRYQPDRWMTEDQEKKKEMMNSHLPFSTGPRACIGRNIAYFEQTVVIATIVKFYDGKIADTFELETQERFNSNPGDLPVEFKRRHC
ncbi:benzoate 4-monooxygenase cytochrome p450 protein [Purpureocillium lilacinum]|uniref:Benzoate 4-monooxygenase cytochrome p450 protein n=1 Tax=Purpureocillium lilacinum TaxID=33203 RepID=A0A179HKW0_PURLI|nr:benzoate 4-monooxygenase cytochrome p450 protein [Purpureocillium lilacinum]OAQ90109.1 benzoate 4-monooxygenase cytochrome p450 protein [Purpureocillium lilacinum]